MNKILWVLFGNDEDTVFGPSWFMPHAPLWKKRIFWWIRNPFHNLFFHVWGIYGKPTTVTGDFPDSMFNPNGGFNRTVLTTVDGKRYPYISYRGTSVEWYIGWRPTSGAFGMALRKARAN